MKWLMSFLTWYIAYTPKSIMSWALNTTYSFYEYFGFYWGQQLVRSDSGNILLVPYKIVIDLTVIGLCMIVMLFSLVLVVFWVLLPIITVIYTLVDMLVWFK